jgi:hypothetical protein
MNKHLVLATLLAVSMSAVRAENKTTFQKVKDVTCDVVTHPATKITAGVAIVAASVLNLVKYHSEYIGDYTNKLTLPTRNLIRVDFADMDSYGEKAKSFTKRVLKIGRKQLPVAAGLTVGLYLIGSGIYDAVKRIQGEEKKA